VATRQKGDVEDHRVVGQLVEVRDGRKEDIGSGGDGGELAGTDGAKDGEERVGVVADRLDLKGSESTMRFKREQRDMEGVISYLWDRIGGLSDKALVFATSISLEVGREV
jgi:hypothetical protein